MQLALDRKRRVRLKTQKGAELEPQNLHAALKDFTARLQAVDLDEHHVLFQRRGASAAHAFPNEHESFPVCFEKLLCNAEISLGGKELPGFEAHLGPKRSLALGDLDLFERQLRFGDRYASRLAAVQIQRQGHPGHDIVIWPGDTPLHADLEQRVWTKPRLEEPPAGRVHFGACGLQLWVVPKRPLDQCIDGQHPCPTRLAGVAHARRKPGKAGQENEQRPCPASHPTPPSARAWRSGLSPSRLARPRSPSPAGHRYPES